MHELPNRPSALAIVARAVSKSSDNKEIPVTTPQLDAARQLRTSIDSNAVKAGDAPVPSETIQALKGAGLFGVAVRPLEAVPLRPKRIQRFDADTAPRRRSLDYLPRNGPAL